MNTTTPARNTRLRPKRSPSRPASSRKLRERDEEGVDDPGEVSLAEARARAGSTAARRSRSSCRARSSAAPGRRRRARASGADRSWRLEKKGKKRCMKSPRIEGEMLVNWRTPPVLSGGSLRKNNYSGGTLRFVKRNLPNHAHDHHRNPRTGSPPSPEARGRAAQLRQGGRGRPRGLRRAWRRDLAGGDRAASRGRDRDPVSELPQSPGAAGSGLRR